MHDEFKIFRDLITRDFVTIKLSWHHQNQSKNLKDFHFLRLSFEFYQQKNLSGFNRFFSTSLCARRENFKSNQRIFLTRRAKLFDYEEFFKIILMCRHLCVSLNPILLYTHHYFQLALIRIYLDLCPLN